MAPIPAKSYAILPSTMNRQPPSAPPLVQAATKDAPQKFSASDEKIIPPNTLQANEQFSHPVQFALVNQAALAINPADSQILLDSFKREFRAAYEWALALESRIHGIPSSNLGGEVLRIRIAVQNKFNRIKELDQATFQELRGYYRKLKAAFSKWNLEFRFPEAVERIIGNDISNNSSPDEKSDIARQKIEKNQELFAVAKRILLRDLKYIKADNCRDLQIFLNKANEITIEKIFAFPVTKVISETHRANCRHNMYKSIEKAVASEIDFCNMDMLVEKVFLYRKLQQSYGGKRLNFSYELELLLAAHTNKQTVSK
jgi:hypothetical protein